MKNKLIIVLFSFILVLSVIEVKAAYCGDEICHSTENCYSCPVDCGECLEFLNIQPLEPMNNKVIKRGPLTIKVKVFEGSSETTSGKVTATSPLFREVTLYPSDAEYGVFTATPLVSESIQPGQYSILVTAEKKQSKDFESIRVTLDPNLPIMLSPGIYLNYTKGERIYLIGQVVDSLGISQQNASLYVNIYNPITNILNKSLKLAEDGNFDDSYLISFSDPDGLWKVRLVASDEYNNRGIQESDTKVAASKGLAYYVVEFLSPINEGAYSRGSSIPITVSVTEEGDPVKGVEAHFSSPSGEIIELNEVSDGIYSANYLVKQDDSLGKWKLGIEAIKETENFTKVGVSSIEIFIVGSVINTNPVNLQQSYLPGVEYSFSIQPVYEDRLPVKGADCYLEVFDNKIPMIESSPGVYSTKVRTPEDSIGTYIAKFYVTDMLGNKGYSSESIFMKNKSGIALFFALFYQNILAKYWWLILGLIALAYLALGNNIKLDILHSSLKRSLRQISFIKAMKAEAENKYYKERSISKEDFNQIITDYNKRITLESEKQKKIHSRISSLEDKIKAKKEFFRLLKKN